MRGFSTRIRLWDKIGKTMLPSAPLWKVDFVHIEDLERYILMFETGLLDKNGKEIYEGDVLKQLGGRGRLWNAVAEFSFASFWARGHLKSDVVRLDIYLYGDGAKVIGNIHENGDLINGK